MPSKQETFDTMAAHMMRQGKWSGDEYESLLRGPRGLKSPIGHLIPDEKYDPEMERREAWESPEIKAVLLELGHDVDLCVDVDSVHEYEEPRDWPKFLRIIAEARDLSSEILDRDLNESSKDRSKASPSAKEKADPPPGWTIHSISRSDEVYLSNGDGNKTGIYNYRYDAIEEAWEIHDKNTESPAVYDLKAEDFEFAAIEARARSDAYKRWGDLYMARIHSEMSERFRNARDRLKARDGGEL